MQMAKEDDLNDKKRQTTEKRHTHIYMEEYSHIHKSRGRQRDMVYFI